MEKRTAVTTMVLIVILTALIPALGGCQERPEFAIKPQFDEARNFSEGIAVVGIREGDAQYSHLGYIDKTGRLIIDPQFDEAEDFKEDMAPVKVGEKWGYITNPLESNRSDSK